MTEEPFLADGKADPRDPGSVLDGTLGGYLSQHSRPPAFEGSDGHPYTVSPEIEKTPNLLAQWSGYLVFPRWALTGAGIIGHLETPILLEDTSREDVEEKLGALTLLEVRDLLEDAIAGQDRSRDRHDQKDQEEENA